jgi:hypothetical protein
MVCGMDRSVNDTVEIHLFIEYLGEYEAICEMALTH